VAEKDRATAAPEFALCETASRGLSFDLACLTVAVTPEEGWALPGSDAGMEQLGLSEQTVMQGPNTDVLANGRTLLVEDLHALGSRWPMLEASGALEEAPFHSMMIIPLGADAGSDAILDPIAVLAVARNGVQPFSELDARGLEHVGTRILEMLVARWQLTHSIDALLGTRADDRHLAVGLLSGLLGVRSGQALALLRAHAFATGRTLREVSSSVVVTLGRQGTSTAGSSTSDS